MISLWMKIFVLEIDNIFIWKLKYEIVKIRLLQESITLLQTKTYNCIMINI